MRWSLRSDYGLRALIVLAEHYSDGVVRTQTISDEEQMPKRFLEQILHDLRAGGFVQSRRGVAGGYRLARAPAHITVGAVVRHLGEGRWVRRGGDRRGRGGRQGRLETQGAVETVWEEVSRAREVILERLTLADLWERARWLRRQAGQRVEYEI